MCYPVCRKYKKRNTKNLIQPVVLNKNNKKTSTKCAILFVGNTKNERRHHYVEVPKQ